MKQQLPDCNSGTTPGFPDSSIAAANRCRNGQGFLAVALGLMALGEHHPGGMPAPSDAGCDQENARTLAESLS